MSDDRDYKGFENDDSEYTKDGNYFSEKENVRGGFSEDKDSYSERNSNYFEDSQEENYSNMKQDHYEKTDDSFSSKIKMMKKNTSKTTLNETAPVMQVFVKRFSPCYMDLLKNSIRRVHL